MMLLDLTPLYAGELNLLQWQEIALAERTRRDSPDFCLAIHRAHMCCRPANHPGPHISLNFKRIIGLWD